MNREETRQWLIKTISVWPEHPKKNLHYVTVGARRSDYNPSITVPQFFVNGMGILTKREWEVAKRVGGELKACPVCEHRHGDEYIADLVTMFASDDHEYVVCQDCGLRVEIEGWNTIPRISETEMK